VNAERTVFLADAHLRPGPRPEQNERLAAFLRETAAGASRLVLLGDAFNCWFERGERMIGDYAAVLALFTEAAERGLAIHHVSGNRDFVVGAAENDANATRGPPLGKWGRRPSLLTRHGIEPHGLRYVFEQGGKRVHCLHGDLFCTRDLRYRVLRQLLQRWPGRLAAGFLPLSWIEGTVRNVQENHFCPSYRVPLEWRNIVTAAAVPEVEAGADLVVCGHVHHDDRRPVAGPTRRGELLIVPPWVAGGYHAELAGDAPRILGRSG
jgi:UDP-2,3-diacylglucosamine pyrophosphatase LpxH